MSREKKFRVWDGKKYHYPECFKDKTNHYLQFGSNGVFYLHSAEGDFICSNETGTIEQFTGLKDKNGIEIYEGDVIIDREIDQYGNDISSFLKIEYCEKHGCYCVDNSYLKNGSSLVPVVQYIGYDNLEVIGNISKNPELLKER